MAFATTRPRFPNFQDSKNYFKTGIGGEDLKITRPTAPATGPTGTTTVETPTTQPAGGAGIPPVTTYTAPPATAPPPTAGGIDLGYFGQEGTTTEKLFDPWLTARESGEMKLGEFADMFRTEAGPGRTYEDIGAEETLGAAVGGGPMEPARGLVGAQYQGPTGLDPTGVGNLQDLANRLRTRREALGTGIGVTSTLQAGIPGLTLGEAKYTAQHGVFSDPTYRAQLAEAFGPTGAFGEKLTTERESAETFAKTRAEQEADIAKQSREYLTGRQTGISGDIGSEIDRLNQQALEAERLRGGVGEAEGFRETIDALEAAQAGGLVPEGIDLSQLDTEARKAIEAAPGIKQGVMEKYPTVAGYALGVPGVGKRGLASPHIRDPVTGELKDYRDVIPKELQKAWTDRQAALEQAFNPLRQEWMKKYPELMPETGGIDPGLLQTVSPIYYGGPEGGARFGGEAFSGDLATPELKNYLQFDPGTRPSRGNVSTEEQRGQFNRISDLLGELDRIEKTDVFRAASIGVGIEEYLDAEEEAVTTQAEKLGTAGQTWLKDIKALRKRLKKAKKKAEWAKVGQVVGGVLGAVVGSVGGPVGTVAGTAIGSQLGGQAAGSLA